MADSSKTSQWMSLTAAILSAVSVLGVGYLAYRANSQATGVQRQEVALAQNRFNAEERTRFEANIVRLMPSLLGPSKEQRDTALATLFVLYPERAQAVLTSAHAAVKVQSESASMLQPAIERARSFAQHASAWVIVAGSDRSLDAAQTEVNRARKLGYTPTVYHRRGWYMTTVGSFPSRVDAERVNIAVSATMRPDAFVVDLGGWCSRPQKMEKYVECAP